MVRSEIEAMEGVSPNTDRRVVRINKTQFFNFLVARIFMSKFPITDKTGYELCKTQYDQKIQIKTALE